jgi:hypothetical protein
MKQKWTELKKEIDNCGATITVRDFILSKEK